MNKGQKVTSNEQRAKSNEQKVTSNKQQAKSNEQRATSEKLHLIWSVISLYRQIIKRYILVTYNAY